MAGVPLVGRVTRAVIESRLADRVLVATDDERIAAAAGAAGAEVRLQRKAFRSGSDRVADAVADLGLAGDDVVVNVQGDEPLVDAAILGGAVQALGWSDIGTVAVPVGDELICDQDTVKVQVERGMALAFARDATDLPSDCQPLAHVGVYAFLAATLRRFAELPSTAAERTNGLEQLRALDHGMRIGCRIVCAPVASINRPEDVPRVEALI